MNCKHCEVKGKTTKYYYCKAREKAINEHECVNCMLKLPDLPKGFEKIFGRNN